MASIAAGRRVAVPGPHSSIMAGLNCGVPSLLAWPVLSAGLDAVIAIDDEAARDGVRRLAHAGIIAGECAGAAAGALLQLLTGPDQETHRDRLGVDHDTAVLMLATEGPTDAGVYDEIVSVPSAESIRAGQ
jgi:diaminopropionate ammonia-lyase